MKFCWHDWEVVENKQTRCIVDELEDKFNYHNLNYLGHHNKVDAFGYTFSFWSDLHEDKVCLKCGTCKEEIEAAKMKIIKHWKQSFKLHGKDVVRKKLANKMWKDKCG